jgi:hypothetical protein
MTPAESLLPIEQLRKLVALEGNDLIWLTRDAETHQARDWRRWNTRYAGKPAFIRKSIKGYLSGRIHCRHYSAHRVVWALVTGSWPKAQIDHINGNTSDNRISNLREASSVENARNQKRHCTNISGRTGVHFQKAAQKFVAYIRIDNKKHHLGYFETFNAAAEARAAAERHFNFHPNHGETR